MSLSREKWMVYRIDLHTLILRKTSWLNFDLYYLHEHKVRSTEITDNQEIVYIKASNSLQNI